MKAPYTRLYWHSDGGSYITPDGETEFELQSDKLYLIRRNVNYSVRNIQPFRHFHIAFQCSWDIQGNIYALPIRDEAKNTIQQIIDLGHKESESPETAFLAYRLLFLVLDELPADQRAPHTASLRLSAAFNQLLQNAVSGISNAALADTANMSVNHFIRSFKTAYGITPQQYIIVKRCEVATALLNRPQFSIEQIADLSGFYDRFHLTKVFRKYRGITPAAYRKNRELD